MLSSYEVSCFIFLVLATIVFGAPVNPQPKLPDVKEGTDPMDDNFMALEYRKYLEEVIQVLESDEKFKAELDKMDENVDLANGQVAHYLQFANKNTRTKLDELKRLEIRRLKDLHKKLLRESADEIRAGIRHPKDTPQVDLEHVDHGNPNTFEMDDLKKLIKKTTDDLTNLDKKRRDEFKHYEMNKEHEYREKLEKANEEEAAKLKQEHEEQQKRHKDHEKLNHPGNKQQLEEVWKDEDHMDPDRFDPVTFFKLHDIDGDGYWSVPEIEALFQKELDKVYNSSDPDDDMVERDEEMNRMREHVFNEIDTDRDQYVSMDEFIQSTKSDEFDKDDGWDTLDGEDVFDSKEYDEYEKAIKEQEEKLKAKNGDNHQANQPPPPVDAAAKKHDAQADPNAVKHDQN